MLGTNYRNKNKNGAAQALIHSHTYTVASCGNFSLGGVGGFYIQKILH